MLGYLKQIMICIIDDHAIVQESACTNFSKLVESGANLLLPYIKDILQIF